MSQADKIRAYANRVFIEAARKAERTQVLIEAADVHRDLKLKSRMPAVYSALDAQKFQDDFGVLLSSRTGPRQGATVRWTFSLAK
jgi:hypothetical protein